MSLIIRFICFFLIFLFFPASEAKEGFFTSGLLDRIQKEDLLGNSQNDPGQEQFFSLTLKTTFPPEQKMLDSLKSSGCKINSVVDEYVLLEASVSQLQKLSQFSFIEFIGLPTRYQPDQFSEELQSEAKKISRNKDLSAGKQIRIAVIDSGFRPEKIPGYRAKTSSYSLRIDNEISGGDWRHGNAVLEIINRRAPGAEILLINIDDQQDSIMILQAIKHAVEVFSADIVSLSVVDPHPRDFFDGSGIYGKYLKNYAGKMNKIFVVPAGNNLKKHYSANFQSDKRGYHQFAKELKFRVKEQQSVRVVLSWQEENFFRPLFNLDLELTGSHGQKIISDSRVKEAVEIMEFVADQEDIFKVKVRGKNVFSENLLLEQPKFRIILYSDQPLRFEENFNPDQSLDPNLPVIPEALTICATKNTNTKLVADYSSRGDSENAAKKPDFCAPAGFFTSARESFTGTSASVPVVTGMIAEIMAKEGKLRGHQKIRNKLKELAADQGKKGWDPIFGNGLLMFESNK